MCDVFSIQDLVGMEKIIYECPEGYRVTLRRQGQEYPLFYWFYYDIFKDRAGIIYKDINEDGWNNNEERVLTDWIGTTRRKP